MAPKHGNKKHKAKPPDNYLDFLICILVSAKYTGITPAAAETGWQKPWKNCTKGQFFYNKTNKLPIR